ncbi:MAG: PaaI family thioesterase [Actinomycetota bacterium]
MDLPFAALPDEKTIHGSLGISIVSLDPDKVVLQMAVGPQVHQPFGLLHGGASAVMAESAASIGALLNCDVAEQYAVGVDLNISHLKAMRGGSVTATATPIRMGRTLHVWAIELSDENGAPVAAARCTLAIRDVPSGVK